MKMHQDVHRHCWSLLLILLLLPQLCRSWSWSFSSDKETQPGKNVVSVFSMESLNDDQKGLELINNAKNKMLAPNSCWQTAYQNIFEGCAKTLGDEELRSRLAWYLTDCFQRHTGRTPFPYCDAKANMKSCLTKLDRNEHHIYLQYFLETNSICHQLQTDAFKQETERLVNELKSSAEYAEVKLEAIEQQGSRLLQNAKNVQDSLSSLNMKTQQVAKTTKIVEDHVNSVLTYSETVYEQSKGIAASQVELSKGQSVMKESLAEGMTLLQDSYKNLGVEIVNLRDEAIEIEKEIAKVGDEMFTKMKTLQTTADDIGELAGSSLDKQKQLLDQQSEALEGLRFLTKFQSKALEESRVTLQKLSEFGHKQQEELLERQKELHQSHDHLVENSKLILATQEAFEAKQSTMLVAIDKLFTLHSAMLFESRVLIALFLYSIAIFIVFLLTSIKHAYNVRHRLYLGLCITFLIEVTILWYITVDSEQKGRMIYWVRTLFGLLATVQYLYAIFTYRDYEMMNHRILMTLMDKVNRMQENKELLSWETDSDSEINWSSWVDTDLPEDVNLLEDPDYLMPGYSRGKLAEDEEEEKSSVTNSSSRRYSLRRRF